MGADLATVASHNSDQSIKVPPLSISREALVATPVKPKGTSNQMQTQKQSGPPVSAHHSRTPIISRHVIGSPSISSSPTPPLEPRTSSAASSILGESIPPPSTPLSPTHHHPQSSEIGKKEDARGPKNGSHGSKGLISFSSSASSHVGIDTKRQLSSHSSSGSLDVMGEEYGREDSPFLVNETEQSKWSVDGESADNRSVKGGLRDWRRTMEKTYEVWIPKLFPALAVVQWWFFNVSLVLLNKWIFQVYGFTFPLTLTTIHFVISFCGAAICIRLLHMKPLASVSGDALLFRVLPMACVTNLNVCLGNVSLRFIPVTFMQTIKAFTPASTVILQMAFQQKTFDPRVYLSLLPVVGGVTLASATELSFHFLGFAAALTSTIFTSANSILAEVLLKGHVEMDSLNTVYYMAPLIVFMLCPLAIFLEAQEVVHWYYNSTTLHVPLAVILFSGLLAFGLNFSLFYAIQATSAMTFNVAGNLKVAVAMLFGWMIFRNPMSVFSALGCSVTVIGCTWYGYVQLKVRQDQLNEMTGSGVDLERLTSARKSSLVPSTTIGRVTSKGRRFEPLSYESVRTESSSLQSPA